MLWALVAPSFAYGQKDARFAETKTQDSGLAPEVTDLNAEDVSYELERTIPDLAKPFTDVAPANMEDGIPVGELGRDGGNKELVLKFAQELAQESNDPKTGKTDSLLISYKDKLIFEAYFRRGRINYPHYQMSITKSYTAMALGRAIQLGHLTMDDLHKPAISFFKDVKPETLVKGADGITLHQAMHMASGIRLDPEKAAQLRKTPERLEGQGQIQAYLENSESIPPAPRDFKYQASDPARHPIRPSRCRFLRRSFPGAPKTLFRRSSGAVWESTTFTSNRTSVDSRSLRPDQVSVPATC